MLIVALTGFATVGAAGSQMPGNRAVATPSCPANLITAQSAEAVSGWEVIRQISRGRLDAFAFYDGVPADGFEQAPSGTQRRGANDVSTWTFEAMRGRPHLVCQYRATDVVLVKPLAANVRQCSVTIGRVNPNLSPQSLSCR